MIGPPLLSRGGPIRAEVQIVSSAETLTEQDHQRRGRDTEFAPREESARPHSRPSNSAFFAANSSSERMLRSCRPANDSMAATMAAESSPDAPEAGSGACVRG